MAMFKGKREIIFLVVSILLLVLTILYIIYSIHFLASRLERAVGREDLLTDDQPVSFNLEKFVELELPSPIDVLE